MQLLRPEQLVELQPQLGVLLTELRLVPELPFHRRR